jgi:hypothetical protein
VRRRAWGSKVCLRAIRPERCGVRRIVHGVRIGGGGSAFQPNHAAGVARQSALIGTRSHAPSFPVRPSSLLHRARPTIVTICIGAGRVQPVAISESHRGRALDGKHCHLCPYLAVFITLKKAIWRFSPSIRFTSPAVFPSLCRGDQR